MDRNDRDTKALLRALHLALVHIRADAHANNTTRIAAIADAFHELPVMLAGEDAGAVAERFTRLFFLPLIRAFPELSGLLDIEALRTGHT